MLKLIRVDTGSTPDPNCSIVLPPGLHPFGRGVFLDCEDKRVSRQHGHLEVAGDTVKLTALHTNPCFIIKQKSPETQILKSGSSETLTCGDKFGVLPNSHWYELTVVDASPERALRVGNENTNGVRVKQEEDEEIIDFPFDGDMEENAARTESPSLLDQQNKLSEDDAPTNDKTDDQEAARVPENEEQSVGDDPPGSPPVLEHAASCADNATHDAHTSKRAHTQDTDESAGKQARLTDQHEDVKPSTSALDAAMAAAGSTAPHAPVKTEVKADPDAAPRAPSPPRPLARERCMYGAQCYRKNPQHKVAYSHPADADWGAGPQGTCPWGAACVRRDPRHWRDHAHPPGTRPPAARVDRGPFGVVERHGRTFYVNAHAVHFHDDHFSVEDSDGESVDYDYEF